MSNYWTWNRLRKVRGNRGSGVSGIVIDYYKVNLMSINISGSETNRVVGEGKGTNLMRQCPHKDILFISTGERTSSNSNTSQTNLQVEYGMTKFS